MDGTSSGKGDGRQVNWSHPMSSSSHLPPKSPGGYSMFGSGSSLFESDLLATLPLRGGGHHKRTPSAGYLPNVAPTWLEEILESPDGEVVVRKGSHRRSSSDSVAFLDTPQDFANFVENVTEEEFILREPPPPIARPNHRRGLSADYQSSQYDVPPPQRPSHRRGMSADYNNNRLDKEQLMSVLSELEPFQTQLPRHRSDKPIPRVGGPLPVTRPASSGDSWSIEKWKKHVTLSVPSSTSDSPSYERGKNLKSSVTTSENRSTGSDSNSHSDESNDELQSGSVRRGKIEQDAQSKKEVDGSRQAHGDGTEVDPSLDPKKAKRILANRQSAQRSRVRKLQYISELERSVNALQVEVSTMTPQVGFYDHRRAFLTAENVLLKQKLAALSQSQRYKEAQNESLKKEVQRLLQIFNQQNQSQQQIQVVQHRPLSPNAYDIPQQFSKLDLGPSIPKPKSPDLYSSGGGGKTSTELASSLFAGGVASSLIRSGSNVIRPPSQSAKGVVSSSCMVSSSGKSLEGRMMGGSGTLSSDFMVHNS
ncbi:uncharacterized protein [Physcomitrium patens]|uniref:BZIP domain-containing protein n=1 Tax=Physcomitrium patens TaxID=3218 RepID=A0A2K1KER3_PHYPA|nr:basic leucine zipper 61-like isoform X1 [Physcomitrium patens]XP_024378643.1 basic leucine zipper 61-like isoform X1 [Physcomitrium patens]XP_024378644.1 basic leucine zipper 61-like isoform X1 [Physcomitrium patens]XP_024378645.1 basic leucine zipper 61-like isoform X1 [Physcomitrium patens]XP_024378646.1 basic leucine zipper 61-like isoform X1 [Physcomitrium patens]PNR52262.1 hypothetical protein PHYPA_008636 [Physcomitrium patens]|eukprot:XP_024378642.1 basic leucine zipper 61-like isoform X1 [Physcomitrella patens]